MFANIRVSNIRGLQECTLLNLGKINVICGKNNTGKSTLLEGISSTNRAVGKYFTEKDIKDVHDRTVDAMGFTRAERIMSEHYLNLLRLVLKDGKIWFSHEEDTFIRRIKEFYHGNEQLRRWVFGEATLRNSYAPLFPEQFTKTVLLPPKRHLQLITRVHTEQAPVEDGDGILNYLFYCKNQISSSEERKIYEQISTAFTTISTGYKLNILLDRQNELTLQFAYKNLPWRSAKDCGLGLQDLLVILCFAVYPEYQVILIEEPESHIHPDMQRKLLSFLREKTDKQYFMTTHSNVFLNTTLVDKIFFSRFEDQIKIDDASSRAAILNDLGYTVADNLVSDLIILVEGPSDTPIIEEFLVKFGLFSSCDIKIWPLGGDIMDQVDLSVFVPNYTIIALVDNDPGSAKIRNRFIRNCKELNIPVFQLKRYAIENYFSLKALREVFSTQIPASVTTIDPSIELEKQIGMNVKKRNRNITRQMVLEDIAGTDLYDFFEKVKSMCEKLEK